MSLENGIFSIRAAPDSLYGRFTIKQVIVIRKEIIFPCVNLLIFSMALRDMVFYLLFFSINQSHSPKLITTNIRHSAIPE